MLPRREPAGSLELGGQADSSAADFCPQQQQKEPAETDAMLEHGQGYQQQQPTVDGDPAAPLQNGSGGHNTLAEARAHSSSPRRIPLFERASARWWNPQFASPTLETQYWKCSFPLLRDRFRLGLIYIFICCVSWMAFLGVIGQAQAHHWLIGSLLSLLCMLMYWFTSCSGHYQRFYLPTSFLCTFLLCLTTLFIFSSTETFMGPLASMATSIQVILLVYAVIPFPLYLCIISCGFYSFFFEILASPSAVPSQHPGHGQQSVRAGTKAAIHICVHLLGIHLYILTQVRQRKTFLKVGQSLLARKDLELETQFKDHMIQSVMPKKVADELLKETSELRRPSASLESHSNCRTSGGGRSSAAESTVGLMGPNGRLSSGGVPNVRKFRPFTMNLMNEVSILFADIAGFTKMASNKSADELVNLLNDLFGRFDYLCGRCNLEKISTLGDCYYCVAGCPEPRPDHAKCCVEMGLAMIIAIRQFDLDRGQNVNMRVGIHTGKVMCGMVGTKRFKFDVFSNDVTLANEMESTGVAGRVHVSGKTADYLDGAYVLEEAAPHQGMKTFFIAGRSKEFESASGQFGLNTTISGDSDSARDGLVSGESGAAYKASFRKKLVDKLRTIQTNSLPPVSRTITTTTTSQSQQQLMSSIVGGGSLRMRLLDRSLELHGLNNGKEGGQHQLKNNTGSAQMLASIGESAANSAANNGVRDKAILPQNRLVDDTRKSASLQMLAHGDGVLPPTNSPANELANSEATGISGTVPRRATTAAAERRAATMARQQSSTNDWHTSERIGGKISAELAHESSANNSGKGSRSSGLQDVGSEAGHSTASLAALDTAISHHHNAASLTRFDTDHRDFDQRLAQVIHCTDGSFAKGFWMHQESLNRWTLNFNQRDIENEYRAHFAAGDSSERHSAAKAAPTTGIEKHRQLSTQLQRIGASGVHSVTSTRGAVTAAAAARRRRRPRYRYSGVFIDIFVSAFIFVVCTMLFLLQPGLVRRLSLPFLLYISCAALFLAAVIVLVGLPLLSRKPILPWLHQWAPRHVLGALMIALPVGVALFNMPMCTERSPPDSLCIHPGQLVLRLLYSYILLLALFAHCNFSQLGAWPKTGQALAVAVIFLLSTWFCQHQLDQIRSQNVAAHLELKTNGIGTSPTPFALPLLPEAEEQVSLAPPARPCNRSQPAWSAGRFGSPLFLWELALDVALAVVLVAFLNYQFEAAFRMSFFGDVQARRDTAKMQLVRDQADWLLNNIIPGHAVESLKTNTKYSENHKLTAVMFASITNWHEMYEENFEGGREFLRVLNEVIGDFDELLDRPEFAHVEKIKTIGPCYMAASGLNPERRRLSLHPYEHLYQLMEFAIGLQNALAFFNQDLLNFEFECKIGFNIGPVTAGVIGTTKLYYDIWGDTVNIASRMYQTGLKNRIQVSSYTRDLLIDRYDFEYRDRIQVKGVDGGMDTFLLVGRKGEGPLTFPFNEK